MSKDRKRLKRKVKMDELETGNILKYEHDCKTRASKIKCDIANAKRPGKSRKRRSEGNECRSIDEVDSISTEFSEAAKLPMLSSSAYFLSSNDNEMEVGLLHQNRKSGQKLEQQTLTSKIKYLNISPGKKVSPHDAEKEDDDFETIAATVKSPVQSINGRKSKNKQKSRTSNRIKSRNTKNAGMCDIGGLSRVEDHTNEDENKNIVESKTAVKRKLIVSQNDVRSDNQVIEISRKDTKKQRKDKPATNENKTKKLTTTKQEGKSRKTSARRKTKKGDSVNQNQCVNKQTDIIKAALPTTVDHSDITAVLLHMEGPGTSQPSRSEDRVSEDVMSDDASDGDDNDNADSDDDEGEDWEDVEDDDYRSPAKSQLPTQPVEVMLEAPVIYKKKKKRGFDWKVYVKRQMNKYQKNLLTDIHKVNLLCLISRGLHLNKLCRNDVLQAQAMSIIGIVRELNVTSVTNCSATHMTRIVNGIVGKFKIQREVDAGVDLGQRLQSGFQAFTVYSSLELVLVYVILLRELGFLTRLVMSLQPLPLKPSSKGSKAGKRATPPKSSSSQPSMSKDEHINSQDKPVKNRNGKNAKPVNNVSKHDRRNASKSKSVDTCIEKPQTTGKLKAKNSTRRSCASKISPNTYKETNEELTDNSDDKFVPVDDSGEDTGGNDSDYFVRNKNGAGRKGTLKNEETEGSDNDFVEGSSSQAKTLANKLSRVKRKQQTDQIPESDGTCCDEWVEVYLQSEQKWLCVDCATGKLNKPYEIEQKATQPVTYILGFARDGTIKDVTARYASQWLTNTKKLRVDTEWWEETLQQYKSDDQQIMEQEDKDIQGHLIQRPLPTNMGALKNHPLYVLRRHLLKFEAIYPDTAIPVGYIRGEPIYARECVHTLHSRENWLKEGQAVRVGEDAYKFVKSRPKWNKPKENPDALDLQLFGPWQTELYIPPPAVDGKVPRNAHGNVEMFLPTMLPAGTVHLQIPALNRVAKKLGIDCAPAMVGWEQHSGFSHPLMDGWIVCEEFKDTLLAAWDEEQEIVKAREAEKREKRVTSNWRLLIRGLLIKERLKKRFDLEEEESQPSTSGNQSEKAADSTQSWPRNRQTSRQTDEHTLCMVEKL